MFFGRIPEPVKHDARLNPGKFPIRIQFKDSVHVLREINDHRHIAALAGQAGAASAREYGRTQFPARRHSRDDVRFIARQDQPNGRLPVVGSIRSIESAGCLIEADLAPNYLAQLLFQLTSRGKRFVRVRLLGGLRKNGERGWGGHGHDDVIKPVRLYARRPAKP
jgi:hypothetical protein